jgi:uncharacterized protein YceK
MKNTILLILALSTTALGGCASVAQQRVAQEATRLGTPDELVRKMERGARLALTDLETLARQHVPDEPVLAYLRQSGASYELTTVQIDQMRTAGVSVGVIDYLLSTPTRVAYRYRSYYGGGWGFSGNGYWGHGLSGHGLRHGLFHHGRHH